MKKSILFLIDKLCLHKKNQNYAFIITILQIFRIIFILISMDDYLKETNNLIILCFLIIFFELIVLLSSFKNRLKIKLFLIIFAFTTLGNHFLLINNFNFTNFKPNFFDGIEIGMILNIIRTIFPNTHYYLILIIPFYLPIFFMYNFQNISNLLFYIILSLILNFFVFKKQKIKLKIQQNTKKRVRLSILSSKSKFKSRESLPKIDLMSSIPIEMVDNFSLLTQNKINILDSLDQGIIVFDENLKIKYYNDYISKLFQIENRDEINVLILNLKEDIKYKNYSQYKKIPQTDLTNFFNRFNKKLEIISSNSENISKEFIKSKSTYIVKSFDTTILQKGKSYTPIKFQTTIPENKRNSIRIITEKSLRRKSSYTLKGFDLLNDIDYLINDNLEDYLSFFIRKGKENNLKTFRDYLTRIIQHSKKTRENISMNGSICDFNNYIMIAKYSKNDQILLIDFQKYIEKSLNFEEYIITIKDISANNFLIDSYEGYTNDKKFISTLCHELKTPLNSITNMINLIKDSVNNTNEEIQEITNDLYINSMFMVNTVNDFLDFFYLKSNNFELDLKNFDLIKLINEIAESYSVLAKRKSLKFQVEYDIDIPNTIVNDEGRIKQILYNLLSILKFID